MLTRKAPSHCPICHAVHHAENPYIFIVWGKVYWDCRRSSSEKLLLGYLTMTIDELITAGYKATSVVDDIADDNSDDDNNTMMFGDYKIVQAVNAANDTTVNKPSQVPTKVAIAPVINTPIELRLQNVATTTNNMAKEIAIKKYIRSQAEDLTGARSLSSVIPELPWSPGLK